MNNRLVFLIPFLILLYFFVHYIEDYFYFLKPSVVFTTLIKYLVVTGVIYWAGFKIFKEKEKYILAFSTILFIFLFFGAISDTAEKYKISTPAGGAYFKMLIAFLIAFIAIIFFIRLLNRSSTRKLLLFWIVYCAILIIYDTGMFILSSKKENQYLNNREQLLLMNDSFKPTVYYLLFDMYPSDSVLGRYFNFDNTSLSTFLTQNEFFVTGNSHSLYDETYYSLSSTLNLETLKFYTDSTIEKYKKVLLALKRTENSRLLSAFERHGYNFRNFSVFNLQGQSSPLEFNLNYHIDNILTATTLFNRIYNEAEPDFLLANKNINFGFLKKSWSERGKKDNVFLNNNFDSLLNMASNETRPGFNYFHFMIPHPPLLYDSNGVENSVNDMYFFNNYEKGKEKYLSYTKYGNKKIKEMVNKIFEKAGKNVIIIIQGDHGFREFSDKFPGEVRRGILNAVYLPNKNYTNFNDTMSPVFTFKQILNNQFGTFFK